MKIIFIMLFCLNFLLALLDDITVEIRAYPDGYIEKKYFSKGELVGLITINDLGKIVSKEGTLPDGRARAYYNDGTIALEENINHGKLEGKSANYYENSNIRSEYYYKQDVLDGQIKKYYESGAVHFVSAYRKGIKIATQEYAENGDLLD